MVEACDAVTNYWFNVLGVPVLRVAKAIAVDHFPRVYVAASRHVPPDDVPYVYECDDSCLPRDY